LESIFEIREARAVEELIMMPCATSAIAGI
jgi:hypothetical protein